MPRHLRMRRPEEFAAVRREGKAWSSKYLVLGSLPNRLGHNRYGFVVSKRMGKAVDRNRIKRRLRAAVRGRVGLHRTGYDVVIIARRPAATADYATLSRALAELEARASLVATASTT